MEQGGEGDTGGREDVKRRRHVHRRSQDECEGTRDGKTITTTTTTFLYDYKLDTHFKIKMQSFFCTHALYFVLLM